MATKAQAIKVLKSISPLLSLDYINDGENTKAILKTTSELPWANTGSIEDVEVYYEMHTPKSRFWDDVIDQIETSAQIDIDK